jgi:DNA-binding transcriptional ArsR family regulator
MPRDHLTDTFSALADPTRRAILTHLATGESTVTELAKPFKMTMPAITKHLKVLERAGLIQRTRDAQRRPCQLQAAPLREVADWIEQYRQFWEQRLDRLEDYLRDLQQTASAQSSSNKTSNKKGSDK